MNFWEQQSLILDIIGKINRLKRSDANETSIANLFEIIDTLQKGNNVNIKIDTERIKYYGDVVEDIKNIRSQLIDKVTIPAVEYDILSLNKSQYLFNDDVFVPDNTFEFIDGFDFEAEENNSDKSSEINDPELISLQKEMNERFNKKSELINNSAYKYALNNKK